MKVNPYSRMRPARPVVRVEAVEPASETGPEALVVIFLRAQDIPGSYRVNDATERLSRLYVAKEDRVAYPLRPSDDPPVDFMAVGGEPVRVQESMCRDAATFAAMQSDVDDKGEPLTLSDIYSEDELIALCASHPIAWIIMKYKAAALNNGESQGKAQEPSLEPSSPTEPPATPNP